MPPAEHQQARPRTTGEILDDAWRLYLDDAPLLLAAAGLFLVPAACVLIVLLCEPFPLGAGTRFLWPCAAALLWPLTGLGSGVCQEAFHLRTEGRPISLRRCLGAVRKRWLNHLVLQAVVLALPALALLLLVSADLHPAARGILAAFVLLLALPVWLLSLPRHTVLTAGQKNVWRAWRLSRRATGRHLGRAFLLIATRLLLLLFAALNLYLFTGFGMWAAEQLAGLDLAFISVLLSPSNPVFLLILVLLAWWLLTPYNEAVNYLFLVDARTRYEGLDLWYQIEQVFPIARVGKIGTILLLVAGGSLAALPARASERLDIVQQARRDLAGITREVEKAEPYPGGRQWQEPLRQVGKRLDPAGDAGKGRYRWFFQKVDQLGQGNRAADQRVLHELDARLAVIEQSLQWQPAAQQGTAGAHAPSAQDIRRLVPPGREGPVREKAEKKPPAEKERPVEPQEGQVRLRGVPSTGVAEGLGPLLGGLGHLCLMFFVVLLVAVLGIGVALLVRAWWSNRVPAKPAEQGVRAARREDVLEKPDRQNVAALWRQSDELARKGRFLEAVRTLYLAVLALLHQAALIRYERTRTNGEYADQLRRKGTPTHRPFLGLTGLFELKWYGQRSCQAADYQAFRELAETIHCGAKSGAQPNDERDP
jgi:hypothetical protein